jgi:hypothetical protein
VTIDLHGTRGEASEALRRADAAELRAAVLDLLEAWRKHPLIDQEVLIDAGEAIAKAGRENADAWALEWLDAGGASSKHLLLAASFCYGYWQWSSSISSEAVRRIEGLLDQFQADELAYPMALLALGSAVTSTTADMPQDLAATVTRALLLHLQLLEKTGKHPGSAALLKRLRSPGKEGR